MIEFTVPGLKGKDRPRMTRTGHVYTTRQTEDYEETIRWCFRKAFAGVVKPLEGPVSVTIKAYHPAPKTAPKHKRALMLSGARVPQLKPDADNVAKVILDALNGMAYADDKQVVVLRVSKHYAQEPAVYVRVEEVAPDA